VLNQLLWIGGSTQGARPKALVRYDRRSGIMNDTDAYADSAQGEAWLIKFLARGEPAEVCAIVKAVAANCERIKQ
jgi:serine/threonine-protein kinase HipA